MSVTILIVEDEPIIAADIASLLEETGYAVLGICDTGEQAIQKVAERPPDVVLMDIQLGGQLDGIETAIRIRDHRPVPIVFLTSNTHESYFRRARRASPKAFLSKPFRNQDLRHAIELALDGRDRAVVPTANVADAPAGGKGHVLVKDGERVVRLPVGEVLYVAADDYYCQLVTGSRRFLVTKTLKKFSEELDGAGPLLRVHRSAVVNLDHVTEVGDKYLLVGGQRVPVSRKMRGAVLDRLR